MSASTARFRSLTLPALGLLLALTNTALQAQEQAGTWTDAGKLSVGRYAPGAGLLPDGRVLVAGGFSFETGRTHATTELFNLADRSWEAGPGLRLGSQLPPGAPAHGR